MHLDSKLSLGRRSKRSTPDLIQDRAEVQKRLAAYKEAHPLDYAYYVRVVHEVPARAVDMLLYKDMLRYEGSTRLIGEALPELTNLYNGLDPAAKGRIDERVHQAAPDRKDRTFANEVLRELGRHSRRILQRQNARGQ
jgi:hypothetical protein